jgi:hypothetical protein
MSKISVEIAEAVKQAGQLLAQQAEDARKVVANAAADALKVTNVSTGKNNEDHDLLVTLNTKMEDLKEDIQELKDGTSGRIKTLEETKLNIADSYPMLYKQGNEDLHKDHEERIRKIEEKTEDLPIIKRLNYGAVTIILVAVLSAIVYLVVNR